MDVSRPRTYNYMVRLDCSGGSRWRTTLISICCVAVIGCGNAEEPAVQTVLKGKRPAIPRIVSPQNASATGSAHSKHKSVLQPVFEWDSVVYDVPVTYDVELDDSCVAGSISRCMFSSPEARAERIAATRWQPAQALPVSNLFPVGRRYYWRLRACAGEMCSPWTRPRYLDVGRTAGDFNGDGFSDIAVGAPLVDNGGTDRGSVFVYFGSDQGLNHRPETTIRLDDPHNQDGSSFGVSVAVANDVNADGFADLLVGAAGSENFRGFVYVYLGGVQGLLPNPYRLEANNSAIDDWFGSSVASAGDVDGDGFADLLIGASGTDGTRQGTGQDLGVAHIYHGSRFGPALRSTVSLGIGQMDFDQFGHAVTSAGDLNGDGYGDIAIGSPGADVAGDSSGVDRGAVFVYLGSADGLLSVAKRRLVSATPRDHDRFGYSVTGVGDIDGDGYGELLIGAPGRDDNSHDGGLAFVFRGNKDGLESSPMTVLTDPAARDFQRFGTSVAAAGDVNSDGFFDILVGASSQTRGRAVIYHGSREGLSRTPESMLLDPLGDGYNNFAEGVAGAGDINGDGYADVIIGASGADNGGVFRGSAVLYPGTEAGVDHTRPVRIDDPERGVHDHFGHVVAGR